MLHLVLDAGEEGQGLCLDYVFYLFISTHCPESIEHFSQEGFPECASQRQEPL